MKLLRSDFSRVHAVAALAAVLAVILGLLLSFGFLPYEPFGDIHGILGISIYPLILVLPLLLKGGTRIYRAFLGRLVITKRGWREKNAFLIAAKITTWLMALMFLFQLLTGLTIMTKLTYQWFPTFSMLSFHTSFLYILGTLILLHTVLMLFAKSVKRSHNQS